jgi:hypothetical protein
LKYYLEKCIVKCIRNLETYVFLNIFLKKLRKILDKIHKVMYNENVSFLRDHNHTGNKVFYVCVDGDERSGQKVKR